MFVAQRFRSATDVTTTISNYFISFHFIASPCELTAVGVLRKFTRTCRKLILSHI